MLQKVYLCVVCRDVKMKFLCWHCCYYVRRCISRSTAWLRLHHGTLFIENMESEGNSCLKIIRQKLSLGSHGRAPPLEFAARCNKDLHDEFAFVAAHKNPSLTKTSNCSRFAHHILFPRRIRRVSFQLLACSQIQEKSPAVSFTSYSSLPLSRSYRIGFHYE